jgi:hypothetical protein
LIDFNKETQRWEAVNKWEFHILKKLKLAAGFKLDQPDPPNAYDLLLQVAGEKGCGLETISEEE